MIGKLLPVLADKLESLGILLLLNQLLHVLLDDVEGRRVLSQNLLIEGRRKIFLQRMCPGQIDQPTEDFNAPLRRSDLQQALKRLGRVTELRSPVKERNCRLEGLRLVRLMLGQGAHLRDGVSF